MRVSCFSYTWFIYNLNTFRLLVAFTQLLYTHIQTGNISYGAIPLLCSPCKFPRQFPFQSLLLTWNPSFCVVRSRPPWPQVARKLTSPSSNPPQSLPIPNSQHPRLIVRLTKTTSRLQLHRVQNSIRGRSDRTRRAKT
jgi:hypothetical protein